MPATVIVGAQWGDEGKGKIVDLLAQDSDLVCRYQGGPNAGHTVVVGDETYKIRQIPTGIIAGKRSAIGAGCVVDPGVLVSELDDLEARGHETLGLLFVSGNAHLVMPWHVALDGARERRLGRLQIGTTRRGIGPAYADKATRIGIRVQDLLDPKILRQKLELAVAEKNIWLQRVYEHDPFDVEEVVSTQLGYAERLAPYVADTSLLVDRTLRAGERVLFEGAQGTLLDLDHGTYPFVTSSSPIAAGAAVSFGIGPNRIEEVLGVAKAYVTRVGEGPFPSEIVGPDHERVQVLGQEFGTVTGRERRCGWLDLVALRFAVRVNGITSLAVTKLDVLSAFAELPVCVRYRLPDDSETEDFPAHQSDFHHCRPVFEVLDGWESPIDDELPDAALAYVGFVADALGVPVTSSVRAQHASTCSPSAERIRSVGRAMGLALRTAVPADGSYLTKGAEDVDGRERDRGRRNRSGVEVRGRHGDRAAERFELPVEHVRDQRDRVRARGLPDRGDRRPALGARVAAGGSRGRRVRRLHDLLDICAGDPRPDRGARHGVRSAERVRERRSRRARSHGRRAPRATHVRRRRTS